MLSRSKAIEDIFTRHGDDSIYIVSTGYISRAVYSMYPENKRIFYMKGSMGLAPGIALGISKFVKNQVVAIAGDASHLMHLGITHTLRDHSPLNMFYYVLDNGCHESVGQQPAPKLRDWYVGTTSIYKISCDGKLPRVDIGFKENAKRIINCISFDKRIL
jgi:thiamine pyrophosphate-dependent acetolactate synthase large subunit-like protein